MAEEEVPTNMTLMAFSDSEIERLKKEKENNQIKIDNYENASKSLDKLIESQISDNSRKGIWYNAVAPLPTGLFAPPTIDLSNSGFEEFKQPEFEGYGVKVNKSVSENSSNEINKTSSAPIIEDWISDYDEDEILEKVSESANVNSVNTAKGKRVTSVVGEQGINVVKSKACWVWRPKIKVLNHVSKNNGSYICKQFDYVDPTGRINVGCIPDKTELAIPGQTATVKHEWEDMLYQNYAKRIKTSRHIKRGRDTKVVVPGGYTPGCDEGRKKLNELTELCTKLSEKVKHLEDQLKSTTKRRKAKVVDSHEEEDLVSEDPSKTGRILSKATPEEEVLTDCPLKIWRKLYGYGFDARKKIASRRR
ncbi:hypothetical protein Tco_1051182 [Tanacetum coccineum]